MKPVYQYDTYGSYVWATFAVYQHPTLDTFYVADSQSGCSCDSYDELGEVNLSHCKAISKGEVFDEFSRWAHSDEPYELTPDLYAQEAERLRFALR